MTRRRGIPIVAGLVAAATIAAGAPGRPAAATADGTLRLVEQTFVVAGEASTTGIALTIAGEALGKANCRTESDTVRVTAYRPVETRAAASEAITEPGPEVGHVSFGLCGMTRQPNGSLKFNVPITIEAPAADATTAALRLPDAGVIPIGVEVRRAGDVDGSFITFVDRLADGTDASTSVRDRMQVAVAFTLDGGPTLQPTGARMVSEADRDAVNDALDLVEQTGDAPIALAVRPELVEGMYASPADRDAFDELAEALSSDRVSLMSLPYVAVDPSAAASSGAGQLFTDQMRRGEDVFRQLVPGARTQRSLWLFDQAASAGGAELLRESGVQLGALLPPQYFSISPSDRQFEIDYGRGTLPATPVDPTIAAALADPGADPTLAAYHLAAQVLLTREEAANADFGWVPMVEHNMILSTTTGRIGNVETTARLVRLLAAAPQLSLVAAPAVTSKSISAPDGQPYVEAPPAAALPSLADLSSELSTMTANLEAVASMLPPGDTRPAGWRQQVAVAASGSLDDDARATHLDAVRDATDGIRAAITPLKASRFTLGGRHSTIRLTLTNNGPDDLTVRVIIDSTKLEIDDADANSLVQLPAGQSVEKAVPVEARTNGEFPVDVQIVTPANEKVAVTEPVQLSARVNALTGLGQLATGAFVLVLLSWWVQHLRKRRRTAAAAASA